MPQEEQELKNTSGLCEVTENKQRYQTGLSEECHSYLCLHTEVLLSKQTSGNWILHSYLYIFKKKSMCGKLHHLNHSTKTSFVYYQEEEKSTPLWELAALMLMQERWRLSNTTSVQYSAFIHQILNLTARLAFGSETTNPFTHSFYSRTSSSETWRKDETCMTAGIIMMMSVRTTYNTARNTLTSVKLLWNKMKSLAGFCTFLAVCILGNILRYVFF